MSCRNHSDCSEQGTYCTQKGTCEPTAECIVMKDSAEGECPLEACGGDESSCGAPYCNEGGCYCSENTCYPRVIQEQEVCADEALRSALGMPDCD